MDRQNDTHIVRSLRTFDGRRRAALVASAALALIGCGGEESDGDGERSTSSQGGSSNAAALDPATFPSDLEHTFPAIPLAPGEEKDGVCLSWTLDNEEELFVHQVLATNDGYYHHSNWFFVDDTSYEGPDGEWECGARGFEQVTAGFAGGVFFAQSTQAKADLQAFPDGAAFRVPPHARVIGNIHLLNTSDEEVRTSLSFAVDVIDEQDVTVKLAPMSVTNTSLDLPPASRSEFTMSCAIGNDHEAKLGRAPDFSFYYVLPHYHALGTDLRLVLRGGESDGLTLFSVDGGYGEDLGRSFDPPLEVRGAHTLELTCAYDNPRAERVGYGIGDREMCVFLGYTSAELKYGGTSLSNRAVGEQDGVQQHSTACAMISQVMP